MPFLILLLCKFATTTNNMIKTFINFPTQSAQRVSLAFVNLYFKQVYSYTLILCCNYQTFCLPRQNSILKPNPTLLTLYLFSLSLVMYWSCKTLSCESCDLFSFFDFFKVFAASSKPSVLSLLADLSVFPPSHEHTLPNLQLPAPYNLQQLSNLFLHLLQVCRICQRQTLGTILHIL